LKSKLTSLNLDFDTQKLKNEELITKLTKLAESSINETSE